MKSFQEFASLLEDNSYLEKGKRPQLSRALSVEIQKLSGC